MDAKFVLNMLSLAPVILAGAVQYPEVVPAPGLPSLESLGLTSEQLYNMPSPLPADAKVALSPQFNPVCGPSEKAYTKVKGLIACYYYLNNLDTQACVVPSGRKSIHFCYSGDAHANGVSITGNSESSYCRDVARALLYIIDNCTHPDQTCAGAQAAWGNGNLIVSGCSKDWA